MKLYNNLIKLLIGIFSLILLFENCTKNDINISAENEQNHNKENSDSININNKDSIINKVNTKVTFDANVYTLITKTSLNPINTDRYVTVYVFDDTKSIKSENYISNTIGSLSPVDPDSVLTLTSGTYSMYAPGINAPENTEVPEFSTNTISGLKNNIDYIWWGNNDLLITGSIQNITMNLKHCCTQIVIQLIDSSNTSFDTIPTISLTPSIVTDNTWDLITGVITSSTAINSEAVNMPVTKPSNTSVISEKSFQSYYGQITMMPLKMNGNMIANFTIVVNNQTLLFKVELPVYEGDLKAGTSYIYKLIYEEDQIKFNNSVNIIDWVSVNATNTPIILSNPF